MEKKFENFITDSLKTNSKKFNIITYNNMMRAPIALHINHIKVESPKVILLSLVTENQLTLKEHMDNLCRSANYGLHSFCRMGM